MFPTDSGNYEVRVDGDYYHTYDSENAAGDMYNKIAKYRGYGYYNEGIPEMSFDDIRASVVTKPSKGPKTMYKLLDPKHRDRDGLEEFFKKHNIVMD